MEASSGAQVCRAPTAAAAAAAKPPPVPPAAESALHVQPLSVDRDPTASCRKTEERNIALRPHRGVTFPRAAGRSVDGADRMLPSAITFLLGWRKLNKE